MKIEAIDNIKSDGFVVTAGDVVTVPDDVGATWCSHGWAKDVAGNVETGERRVINARLGVQNVKANGNVEDA